MWEASGTRQVAGSPLLIGSKSAWRVASYNKRVQLHKIWDQVQFTANTKNSILHILHMLCNRRHCCCSTWPGVLFNSFVWTYDLPLELHALTLATCWGRESGSIHTQYLSTDLLMRIWISAVYIDLINWGDVSKIGNRHNATTAFHGDLSCSVLWEGRQDIPTAFHQHSDLSCSVLWEGRQDIPTAFCQHSDLSCRCIVGGEAGYTNCILPAQWPELQCIVGGEAGYTYCISPAHWPELQCTFYFTGTCTSLGCVILMGQWTAASTQAQLATLQTLFPQSMLHFTHH